MVEMERSKRGVLYFDGACLPYNPGGVATYGFVIYVGKEVVYEEGGVAQENSTNNVAEYTALVKGLEKALSLGIEELTVRGDSQLVIYQMIGIYSVKSDRIRPLYKKAQELADRFQEIEFEWVPREENWRADKLSEKAFLDYFREKKQGEKSGS